MKVRGIGKMGEGVFIQCMYRLLVGGNVALSLCMYHLLFASLCECVRLGSFITFFFFLFNYYIICVRERDRAG